MTAKQKYFIGSFGVGVVLAILFAILAGTVGGMEYVAASIVSGIAGLAGLIMFFTVK